MYDKVINFLIGIVLEIPKLGLFIFPIIITANENSKFKDYAIGG